LRAGYSAKSASDIGFELTHKPKIIDAITRIMAKREAEAAVDRKWVLARLVQVEAEAAETMKGAKGRAAARQARIRTLHLIGLHRDVNAFRTPLAPEGGANGGGGRHAMDLSGLTDKELDDLERLLAKASHAGSDPAGTDGAEPPAGA
jgi:phage terminase small subunit